MRATCRQPHRLIACGSLVAAVARVVWLESTASLIAGCGPDAFGRGTIFCDLIGTGPGTDTRAVVGCVLRSELALPRRTNTTVTTIAAASAHATPMPTPAQAAGANSAGALPELLADPSSIGTDDVTPPGDGDVDTTVVTNRVVGCVVSAVVATTAIVDA